VVTSDTKERKRKPLITGLCDVGRRNVHAGREGEAKSLLAYQLAVCSAAGNGTQVFNSIELDGKVIPAMNVVGGGNVLIVDEDSTSRVDVETKLDRLALGLGFPDRNHLQYHIDLLHKTDFRFGGTHPEMTTHVNALRPALLIIDSLVACSNLNRHTEHDPRLGLDAAATIDEIHKVSPETTTWMLAHTGKGKENWDLEDFRAAPMQELVRGHGSVVGQVSDTGYAQLKLSEKPNPLIFALIPKIRRDVTLPADPIFCELIEAEGSDGWAKIVRIPPITPPPTPVDIFMFQVVLKLGSTTLYDLSQMGLGEKYAVEDRRQAIGHLLRYGILAKLPDPRETSLNKPSTANIEYLKLLMDSSPDSPEKWILKDKIKAWQES
jgi:AAA domain